MHAKLVKIGALVVFVGFFCIAIPSTQAVKVVRGDGVITLNNLHSHEIITVKYRRGVFGYKRQALKQIKHNLRCRYTGEEHPIRTELIELIDQIQDHFDGRTVEVVSGYRSPELNASLWQAGRKVSKNSPHMYGQAMDIRLPGVSAEEIRDYADMIDKGGVGFYPDNDFVHVDIGVHRRW